jgi:hypothetical protein
MPFYFENTESYWPSRSNTTKLIDDVKQFSQTRADFLPFLFEYTLMIVISAAKASPDLFFALLDYAFSVEGHFSEEYLSGYDNIFRTALNAANDLYHYKQNQVLNQYSLSDFEFSVWIRLIKLRINDLKYMLQYTHTDIHDQETASKKLADYLAENTSSNQAFVIWKKAESLYCLSSINKPTNWINHTDFEYDPGSIMIRYRPKINVFNKEYILCSSIIDFLYDVVGAQFNKGIKATLELNSDCAALETSTQFGI